jgi:hypothetical protein
MLYDVGSLKNLKQEEVRVLSAKCSERGANKQVRGNYSKAVNYEMEVKR